jgi:hypothetical protein
VFSVIAPILSIAFSMTFGIDALLLAAIPIYGVVGFLLARAAAPGEPQNSLATGPLTGVTGPSQ